MNCLYSLENKPLLVGLFARIFSLLVGCLFILFKASFAVQKLAGLIRSHLFIFLFNLIVSGDGRSSFDGAGKSLSPSLSLSAILSYRAN